MPETLVVRRTRTVLDARDLAVSCAVGWNSLYVPRVLSHVCQTLMLFVLYSDSAVTALRSTREQTADIKPVSQLYSFLMRIY